MQNTPDILLISFPPAATHYPSEHIAHLASVLQQSGFHAGVFDANRALFDQVRVDHRVYWHKINRFLWHDRTKYEAPLALFGNELRRIAFAIGQQGSKRVYCNIEYPNDFISLQTIRLLKEQNDTIRVIAGGRSCATKEQRDFLMRECPNGIDYFISAPVMEELPKLLTTMTGGSPAPMKRGTTVTQDVVFPAYDLFPDNHPHNILSLKLGDGCPDACLFCNASLNAVQCVEQSLPTLLKKLDHYINNSGIKEFFFRGIPLNLYSGVEDLCDAIHHRFPDIRWAAGAAPWHVIPNDLLEKMHNSGCHTLEFCPLSGSDRILREFYCSKADLDAMSANFRNTHRNGIRAVCNVMVGFPGERFADFSATRKLLENNLPVVSRVHSCIPLAIFPETPLYRELSASETRHLEPIEVNEWSGDSGNSKVHRVSWVKELTRFVRSTGHEYGGDMFGPSWNVSQKDRWRMRFYDPLSFGDEPFHPHMNGLLRKYAYGAVSLLTGICEIEYGDMPSLHGIDSTRQAITGPEVIHLDLTNRCNLNCIACWDRSPLINRGKKETNYLKQSLDYTVVTKFIDDIVALGGAKSIKLTGGGEPTLHPKFYDILQYIRQKDRYIDIDINTNGTLLTDPLIDFLIQAEINLLTVSLWAATPETYVACHPNQNAKTFAGIVADLKKIVTLKKNDFPRIFIHNVLMKTNFHELERMLALALDIGADEVHFTLVDPVPGRTDSLLLSQEQHLELLNACEPIRRHVDQWNNYRHPETGKTIKITNFNEFCVKLSQSEVDAGVYDRKALNAIPCYIGWLFTRVMADGRVAPCCKGHRLPMGNINKKNFLEIWNDAGYRQFRNNGLTLDKSAPYFSVMGSDASEIPGCANCDNIMHNTVMHDKYLFYSNIPRWLPFKISQWLQKRK